jgi:hypothetical protein
MESTAAAQTVISALSGKIILELPRKIVKRHLRCCVRNEEKSPREIKRLHWNANYLAITVPYVESVDRQTMRIHLDDDQLLHLFADLLDRIDYHIFFRDKKSEEAMHVLHEQIPDLIARVNRMIVFSKHC